MYFHIKFSGDINVLTDCKKIGQSQIMKLLHSHRHHVIDMLNQFSKNHIITALSKRIHVQSPQIHPPIKLFKKCIILLPSRCTTKPADTPAQMHLCQIKCYTLYISQFTTSYIRLIHNRKCNCDLTSLAPYIWVQEVGNVSFI